MISYHHISLPSASLGEIQIDLLFSEHSNQHQRRFLIQIASYRKMTQKNFAQKMKETKKFVWIDFLFPVSYMFWYLQA